VPFAGSIVHPRPRINRWIYPHSLCRRADLEDRRLKDRCEAPDGNVEGLRYENPRLSAIAVSHMTADDFASRLERAIERSGKAPLMIEAKAVELPRKSHS